jgi:hypothetical protein
MYGIGVNKGEFDQLIIVSVLLGAGSLICSGFFD